MIRSACKTEYWQWNDKVMLVWWFIMKCTNYSAMPTRINVAEGTHHRNIKGNAPATLGMQHNIVDILPLDHQKLLAKYLPESISSLWHESQAATIKHNTNYEQFLQKRKRHRYKICTETLTFFLAILTISWRRSFSATCICTMSPQFFMIVSNS